MPREKNLQAAPAAKRSPRRRSTDAEPEIPVERPSFVDPQQRAGLIARAAYFRAMERGFEPGNELSDWLAAEAEVDAELLRGTVESTSA
jgi:DUF2934 family protein